MKTVAIIGGGFSGTMAAVHLLSNAELKCKVLLFEASDNCGRGIAYGVKSDAFLLNVPANTMGALPEDPEHFYTWVEKKKLPFQASDFIPRRIYGDYLQSLLEQAVESNANFQKIQALVSDLEIAEGRWIVSLADGKALIADAVIMAIGFPRQKFSLLDPHDELSYAGISDSSEVAIIGSGLTAVDVFEKSRAAGFKGHFTVISRSGKFPHPHSDGEKLNTKLESIEAVKGGQPTLNDLLKKLRRDIAEFGAQEVLDRLRPETVRIWKGLSIQERKRFYDHIESRWNRVRHRMPRSSFDAILKLQKAGQLNIIAALFKDCSKIEDRNRFRVSYKSRQSENFVEVDKVFDCRGPSASPRALPLINNLILKKYVEETALGKGIKTNAAGKAINALAQPLYLIGPLRREELLESTAVREIRQQAFDASRAVLLDLM